MQCHSGHSNYLKKQKLVRTVKSCRDIKVERKGLLELDIRNALVIFKCVVSGRVSSGKSSMTDSRRVSGEDMDWIGIYYSS